MPIWIRVLLQVWTVAVVLVLESCAVVIDEHNVESSTKQTLRQSSADSVQRTLQEPSVIVGNVTSFVLINTATLLPIRVLLNHTVVNLEAINAPNLTIQAIVPSSHLTSNIDYVQFRFDNKNAGRERDPPYVLCGNLDSELLPCSSLTVGTHTISATPYFEGRAGTSKTIIFHIVNKTLVVKSCNIPRVRFETLMLELVLQCCHSS